VSAKSFIARPAAEAWVKAAAPRSERTPIFSARLTIDVTPGCRGRLKIAAFGRGQTVADLLRELLDREFPEPTP
jgi:hypothetical protein